MEESENTLLGRARSHLLRRGAVLAALTLFITLLYAGSAWADTFTVTNTHNSGAGSLREAITKANSRAGTDQIVFADGVSGTITLSTELPQVTDLEGLAIDGGGDVTVSGNHTVGVFWVAPNAKLDVRSLIIANGAGFPIRDVQGCCYRFGGGIYNEGGELTVTDSTISNNGPHFQESRGMGIYNSGTARVTNSKLSGNEATFGGGMYNLGALTVTHSKLSGNSARFVGGAILNHGALTVTDSTISGNSTGEGLVGISGDGGGIYNSGTFEVSGSAILNNFAGERGGGITSGGDTSITNSTFSGNEAISGGGISHCGAEDVTVTNSTFSGNRTSNPEAGSGISTNDPGSGCIVVDGTMTLRSTIIANNAGGGNCAGGPVIDEGYNVDDADTCGFTQATGSLSNTNPLLDPNGLQNNGGPTKTIALQPNSSAVDLVAQDACPPPNTDQRGVARPQGAACDSGAFELKAAPASCTIKGTKGDDFLKGTSANDVICGKGGNDILVDYKGGDDILLGNGGKDILLDLKGRSVLRGGDGSDVLFALDDAPLDTTNGQAGNDFCVGDKGDVRKNCERGSLISLSAEESERLGEAKDAAGL